MPSQKPSMIDALRAKHDPHYQLAGKVEGLGKDLPIKIAQLHKTMSKSFATQRKTLVRVLGLEKRVAELEAAKAAVQEAAEELGVEDEIPEGLDELIDDVRKGKEVGATATKTKPKIKGRKRKIKGKDLKKGTALETPEERVERLKRNKQETAAADEHKKTSQYNDTTTATDEKGEYLSAAERKKRFKLGKLLPPSGGLSSDDLKPDDEAEMGEDDSKKDDIIAFLNGEVKGKLDDINASVGEIAGVVGAQGDLAEERDEDMRQALLAARKRRREGKLEKKKTIKDKMLDEVKKPVGNFLNKLIKFVVMTFAGVVVTRILKFFKNPGMIFDPLKEFFNLFISFINLIMRWSFKITGGPINAIISGINFGVQGLLGVLNSITSKFKLPPIEIPEIPLISGAAQFPMIPLAGAADDTESEGAVAMEGGGVVPGAEGLDGVAGESGVDGEPGDSISSEGKDGADGLSTTGTDGKDGASLEGVQGEGTTSSEIGQEQNNKQVKMHGGGVVPSRSVKIQGGGVVPAPYPVGDGILGLSPPLGYNKGGKVPGSGSGDTVPAMLTPGEFVMSKGAVDQIGVDNLMSMNKAGGGTNKPTMMKFAGGGVVPDIDTPSKKGSNVVVIGGGGGSSAPRGVASSGSSGVGRRFASTDPNNMTIPVIKSLYNIMG